MNGDEYLPFELMIEILLRLPVISLLRFKCVCKSWFSLISDSHFANSHFQITAATHTRRILMISTSTNETRSIDFEASLDDDDSVSAPLNLHFLPPGSCFDLEIKGSCRGFIILYCPLTLYLWNPSTGFHKEIYFSPYYFKLAKKYFYGFGYDHSTDDYLLVSMSVNPLHLIFFSFRANRWKEIEEIEGTFFQYVNACEDEPKAGLLFNGAIHWLAFHFHLRKGIILGFDLIERKIFYMHLPDEFNREPNDCGLWVFGEFLSFWAMNYDNDTVEIWVTKEYKVNSSWTKTRVLPIDGIPALYFSPLRSTKSGDIIGTDDHTGLVKYNDEAQLLGHRSYYNDPRGSQVAVYTESLLSLPGDNEQA